MVGLLDGVVGLLDGVVSLLDDRVGLFGKVLDEETVRPLDETIDGTSLCDTCIKSANSGSCFACIDSYTSEDCSMGVVSPLIKGVGGI